MVSLTKAVGPIPTFVSPAGSVHPCIPAPSSVKLTQPAVNQSVDDPACVGRKGLGEPPYKIGIQGLTLTAEPQLVSAVSAPVPVAVLRSSIHFTTGFAHRTGACSDAYV
jgi:hypothetical protein